MKKNFRLRSLLLAVLVGSNALVFIVSGVSLHNSRQQHEREAETQTQNIAKAIDQSLSASIEKIDLTLRAVADELERQLGAGGIDEQAMSAFLRRHEQRLPEVVEILKEGSAYAEKTAAATLADVRRSMRIDYFDNDNLLK